MECRDGSTGRTKGSKLPLTFPTRDYSHFSPAKIISKIGSNSVTHLAFFFRMAHERVVTLNCRVFRGYNTKLDELLVAWCHFLYAYFKLRILFFLLLNFLSFRKTPALFNAGASQFVWQNTMP